ncbi:MarR family transcriptional regulator [bacterium]|nr:MarR family transcriptional regulator [bacterium]
MPENDELRALMSAWIRMVMRNSMKSLIRYTKDNGLSMSQTAALFKIRGEGACGVNDIGEDLQISSAAASQMMDKLVQLGFVHRSENPDDRRGKRLMIADKGTAFLQGSGNARIQWVDDLVDSLTLEERESTAGAIALLIDRAKALGLDIGPHQCPWKGTIRS